MKCPDHSNDGMGTYNASNGIGDAVSQQRRVECTPDSPVTRARMRDAPRTRNFVFLLVPGFSLMTLAAAMEPLRALNRLARFQAYDWRLASLNGEPIPTSSGIPLPAWNVKEALIDADYLIVCAGFLQESDEQRYLGAIREGASRGINIGAVSTGTRLLARAGILTGYRCTTHWETLHTFRDSFPDLDCTNKLYVIDRDRLTASGGTATLDMILRVIAEHHGVELGRAVANQFLHERIRDEQDDQPSGMPRDFVNLPDTVRRAIRIMRDNIEEPVPVSVISRKVGIGHRQLERLFRKHAGVTPIRFYLRIRVERGRELLIYTRRRIADIAEACGFSTTAHFAASYRRIVGSGPSDARVEKDLLRIAGTLLRPH
jgi:transcriptional regulator GlxA family with amidase domain